MTVGVLRVRPGADPDPGPRRAPGGAAGRRPVLTLDEFIAKERDFWDKVAPIGTVFYIGVVMGFIVGCVICYQVLFSDISDRLGEFATLKAMGYSNLRLFRVVVMQAVYLALLGYLAGLVVSLLLFHWVHEATGLPLDLSRNDPAAGSWLFRSSCASCPGLTRHGSSCRSIPRSSSPDGRNTRREAR